MAPAIMMIPLVAMASLLLVMVQGGEVDGIKIFSFDKGAVPCKQNAPPFTYVLQSDAQLWWWSRGWGDKNTWAESSNTAQQAFYNKVNQLRWTGPGQDNSLIQTPSAVVINGDLTAYGFGDEWNKYRDIYDNNNTNPFRTFTGLGNHDYANNVLDCTDGGIDATTCTRRSVQIMRQTLSGVTIGSALRSAGRMQGPLSKGLYDEINAFDWGSIGYSWDEGSWHFVMMHNHPAFVLDISSYSAAGPVIVTPGYDFLSKELSKAVATGRKTAVFIHDMGHHWDPMTDQKFKDIILNKNVVALFCGHIHESSGLVDFINGTPRGQGNGVFDYQGNATMYFRTGAAEYYTSYVVEFSETKMRMQLFNTSTLDLVYPGAPLAQGYTIVVSQLACTASQASQPAPSVDCPPNWTRDDKTCRAPCLPGFSLEGGTCKRKNSCGDTWMEKDGLLCYKKCSLAYPDGDYPIGVGPLCWERCPDGSVPIGPLCTSARCKDGEELDGNGLCYPKCKDGYYGVGFVCYQSCPSGYKNYGALCSFDGKIKWKGCCCTKFSKGCCKADKCPSYGYRNDPCSCAPDVFAKKSYTRGAGRTPLKVETVSSKPRDAGMPLWASYNQDYYTLP